MKKNEDAFNINKTVCGFNTSGKIGSGSGGNVYLINLPDGKKRALKLIFGDLKDIHKDIVELDILSHFCHPYVVSTHGIYTKENCKEVSTVGYMMDYYPENIFGYIFEDKTKNWKQLLNIFYQIALGMYFLNEYGILHLDLKEENIALDQYGNVKILDPGLSMYNFGKTSYSRRIVGTPFYRSKEIIGSQDIKSYDYTNDVWSYSMMFIDYFGYRINKKCYPILDINVQENYAYVLFSDKHKQETINNNICIDSEFFKGLDIKLLKDFLNFLIQTDKNLRPTFREIISHRIFSKLNRNLELENPKNFTKFIYRYNFKTDNKNNRNLKEVSNNNHNFLILVSKFFFDVDVRFIFLYFELYLRLLCSSNLSTIKCYYMAIYLACNVLNVNTQTYSSEENKNVFIVNWGEIHKDFPHAIKILDGIVMENRIYNYCNNRRDLDKYFEHIINNPLNTEIYENNYIKKIKKTSKSQNLDVNCLDFLIDNYDNFVSVEKTVKSISK